MVSTSWLRQEVKPLFPNIFWESPLNKRLAKKVLILGGHAKQFSATVTLYQAALASGIGEAKVVLPTSLARYIKNQPDCLFVQSTKSGSIAKGALGEIKTFASESDGVIISPELSHNTETISLLESIVTDTSKPIFFTGNVTDMLAYQPKLLIQQNQVLVLSSKKFINLANALNFSIRVGAASTLLNKMELLKDFTKAYPVCVVLVEDSFAVGCDGRTSLTPIRYFKDEHIPLALGALATFYLQHEDAFKSLTSAAFALKQALKLPEQGSAITLNLLRQSYSDLASH